MIPLFAPSKGMLDVNRILMKVSKIELKVVNAFGCLNARLEAF